MFYVDTGGLQVAGHDFGTFVDATLVFRILFDFWTIFDQYGPKFRKCVLGRMEGFGGRWSRFSHVVSLDGNALIQRKMTILTKKAGYYNTPCTLSKMKLEIRI